MNTKDKKGISLIVLIITIVVMAIITTAVVLTALSGANTIDLANKAKEELNRTAAYETMTSIVNEWRISQYTSSSEKLTLDDYLNKMIDEGRLDSKRSKDSSYIIELDGYESIVDEYGNVNEYTEDIKVSDLITSQEVISKEENVDVTDSYNNKVVIPAGFKISEESGNEVAQGIVIQDEDGNEFVWIPTDPATAVDGTSSVSFDRYAFSDTGSVIPKGDSTIASKGYLGDFTATELVSRDDRGTNTTHEIADIEAFKASVEKYGGFYIGRFESSKQNNEVVIKKGLASWTYINQYTAATKSKEMYNTDKYATDLVNSYAWDSTLEYIQLFSGDTDYSIQTHLATDVRCNIYDLASKNYEWTTEFPSLSGAYSVVRGGSSYYGAVDTAGYRGYNINTSAYAHVSFRTVLYFKV